MIVHAFVTHPRDKWCAEFHVRSYLGMCDRVVAVVDDSPEFSARLRSMSDRVTTVDLPRESPMPEVNNRGVLFRDSVMRQAALDAAMQFAPLLIIFGDTDEVPTQSAIEWLPTVAARQQRQERWYVDWVNLWHDYGHAIGGASPWSFQNPNGNKKCFAMQPGGDMKYPGANQHLGLEPGRHSGGPAPTGEGRYKIDAPKLLHLKYASSIYRKRPESRLACHAQKAMLAGGEVVKVPSEWAWLGMPR